MLDIHKLALLPAVIELLLSNNATNIKQIIVFGSYARGEADEWSDLDILVLTDLDNEQLSELDRKLTDATSYFSAKHGLLSSIITQNQLHFQKWVNFLPLYKNIRNEGCVLYAA